MMRHSSEVSCLRTVFACVFTSIATVAAGQSADPRGHSYLINFDFIEIDASGRPETTPHAAQLYVSTKNRAFFKIARAGISTPGRGGDAEIFEFNVPRVVNGWRWLWTRTDSQVRLTVDHSSFVESWTISRGASGGCVAQVAILQRTQRVSERIKSCVIRAGNVFATSGE
jgi:hypothetical protein